MGTMAKWLVIVGAIAVLGSSVFAIDNDSFHFEIPLDNFFDVGDERLTGDIVYDEDTKQMTIDIDGAKTVYCNIPESIAEKFAQGKYAKSFFTNVIQKGFEC